VYTGHKKQYTIYNWLYLFIVSHRLLTSCLW